MLYETALGVGIATGPLLGGLLGNISWRGPFFGVAVLMGIWFVVMGLMEMFGAFAFRHAVRHAARAEEQAGDVSVPGQRASQAAADATASKSP